MRAKLTVALATAGAEVICLAPVAHADTPGTDPGGTTEPGDPNTSLSVTTTIGDPNLSLDVDFQGSPLQSSPLGSSPLGSSPLGSSPLGESPLDVGFRSSPLSLTVRLCTSCR